MHQFNPLSMIATEGDSLEREDRPHYYSDDALWVVLSVTEYLKETGDFAYLDQVIPFYDKNKQEETIESASVLEHLKRALSFTRSHVGSHGLPLLGFADWNDTVNLPAGAESLFTANLYGRALLAMIDLFGVLKRPADVETLQADYEQMRQQVEASAWDGEWYLRYFDAEGKPLGSHLNEKGQIYINAQSWAVMSGFASSEHARTAMQTVFERLNTRNGIKLSAPGYDGFDPRVGGITTYPPGAKENGGIFLHTNPWAMIAETQLGHGERAKLYYDQINPAKKNDQIETYECEPYVYPQNILGDEHPQFGLARNSWLSGTSSWTYQAATQYILGVRAEYEGLRIDPCIPANWEGFTFDRRSRGADYSIQVYNPARVCKGVKRMLVNGAEVPGSLIPYQPRGTHNKIEVWLG
jgi:cellobiose phosphorylase